MNSPIHVDSKLPMVGTTIFSVMSALANECGAINLSQGFPNFEVAPSLIALINESMQQGMNQYSPMPGLPTLRQAIVSKMQKRYGVNYDAETEVTVTSGGTQALFTAILSVINRGDEVIIFDPAYDSYAPAVVMAGGRPIHIALQPPHFTIDWQRVQSIMNDNTRMIVINNPGNPSSQVLSKDDIEMLAQLTRNTQVVVLSDEVYEHLIYDGRLHCSVSAHAELSQRSMVVYSFGKTFHATGWKMGYILAPQYLMTEFRKVHQFNVFSANTPIQHALAVYMNDERHYNYLPDFFQRKRDYFLGKLSTSRFVPLPCAGSYFILLDYSHITAAGDKEYAKALTREHGVASIPVSAFYSDGSDNKLLRFCFAKDDDTLAAAAAKLCAI